jgi:uncharacterized protein YoxC
MVDHIWVIIVSIGFLFLIIGFLVSIGVLVYAALEIKKAALALRGFVERAEGKLDPLIKSTEAAINTVKGIGEDLGHITANARNLSDAVGGLTENIREISLLISSFNKGLNLKAAGIKSGLRAALEVLLKK